MCGRCTGDDSASEAGSDSSEYSHSFDEFDSDEYSTDYESATDDSGLDKYDESSGDQKPTENLTRQLTPLEEDYLAHCRAVMTRLTGEKFIAGPMPWFALRSSDGSVQMSTDGYCASFGMILEYLGDQWDFLEEDVWSLAMSANIPLRTASTEMSKYVFRMRMAAAVNAGAWQIFIPKPADLPRVLSTMYGGNGPTEMTLGQAVEEYLGRRLHQLTAYLPFVGGPRCTCVSKRDPNPAGLNIRQMIKLERGEANPAVRPGQSILDLLRT